MSHRRVLRSIRSLLKDYRRDPSPPFLVQSRLPKCHFTALSSKLLQPQAKIPSDFVKSVSAGFCKNYSFASGFKPLEFKPLESIVDVERLRNRSNEDIASIWDDVSANLVLQSGSDEQLS